MERRPEYDAKKYSYISVVIFGIIGNSLVIISILRQRRLLKNSYYFLVLHLAICDLGWLSVILVAIINRYFAENPFIPLNSLVYCLYVDITYFFQIAGVYMMLAISVLRYHATVHPLKHTISRRKLKFVCGLGYVLGVTAGYGAGVPECSVQQYGRFHNVYFVLFVYYAPTIFMGVLYHRVYRELVKQNKYLKGLCSNPVVQSNASSSLTFLNYIRNRRTFLVCLSTVLCYGIGNIPMSVYLIWETAGEDDLLVKYIWLRQLGGVLRVAGSNSVNPLIYGILDKKLLTFWKFFPERNRKSHEKTAHDG